MTHEDIATTVMRSQDTMNTKVVGKNKISMATQRGKGIVIRRRREWNREIRSNTRIIERTIDLVKSITIIEVILNKRPLL